MIACIDWIKNDSRKIISLGEKYNLQPEQKRGTRMIQLRDLHRFRNKRNNTIELL